MEAYNLTMITAYAVKEIYFLLSFLSHQVYLNLLTAQVQTLFSLSTVCLNKTYKLATGTRRN